MYSTYEYEVYSKYIYIWMPIVNSAFNLHNMQKIMNVSNYCRVQCEEWDDNDVEVGIKLV